MSTRSPPLQPQPRIIRTHNCCLCYPGPRQNGHCEHPSPNTPWNLEKTLKTSWNKPLLMCYMENIPPTPPRLSCDWCLSGLWVGICKTVCSFHTQIFASPNKHKTTDIPFIHNPDPKGLQLFVVTCWFSVDSKTNFSANQQLISMFLFL